MENNLPEKEMSKDFIITEYSVLRDEILKRVEFQHQVLSLTLIVAGTILSIGVQNNVPPIILLLYPIIGIFLAGYWEQNDFRIRQLANYIRENIEEKVSNGWETYRASGKIKRTKSVIYTKGIFVTTDIIALAIAMARVSYSPEEIFFIILDIIAIIITMFIIKKIPLVQNA